MRTDRVSTIAGVASPALLLVTVAAGAVVSPVFDWPRDPFSLIGTTGDAVALAFNAGIVAAGLLALPFATRLWRTRSRIVGGLYGFVGVSFAGAGLFPAPALVHEVFGAGALFGIWLLLWAAGGVDLRAGFQRRGAVALALGTATLVVWLPYDFGVTWAQIGYGAAELVSLSAFAAWSGWAAAQLWPGDDRRLPTSAASTGGG